MRKTDKIGGQPHNYDAIVVGGGHAGAEAAHICARGGLKTLLVTMNLDTIGQLSCNPAIGGIAKGHIVREIDALGGIMARIIDKTGIHFKMLNRSRGPAVWAPRAQAEKREYQNQVKWLLEETEALSFYQDTCESLLIENNQVQGVITGRGHEIYAPAVILTTGTFLQGLIHIGEFQQQSGRIAEQSAQGLSRCLQHYGFQTQRLKTGTPPRVLLRTLDLTRMEVQSPDAKPEPFSFATSEISTPQIDCYITYTNQATHKIVEKNLMRSPMYSGQIKSSGPRYCPSIEDKIVRFADKQRHHIFIEPEGRYTGEAYLNGVSTSLPEEVQWQIVRSVAGMEEAEIIRPGYAVEYDYVDPRELRHDLQTRKIGGLYFAGQINGTTGYEEAAAQGLMAGINVVQKANGREPFVLGREEAYIGVLIDDLVSKGVDDPYRMFTSRAEHRLVLRQDNADQRLMSYAHKLGFLDGTSLQRMQARYKRADQLEVRLRKQGMRPSPELEAMLKEKNIKSSRGIFGKSVADFLRRPEVKIVYLLDILPELKELSEAELNVLELKIKYAGYVAREKENTLRRQKTRAMKLPEDLDFSRIIGLKNESVEKLNLARPANLAQAASISGVDPSDIDLIYIYLKQSGNKKSKKRIAGSENI